MANRKSISYTIAYSYEAEGIGEAKNVGFPIISPLSIFRSTLFASYRVIIMHPQSWLHNNVPPFYHIIMHYYHSIMHLLHISVFIRKQ